MTWCFVVGCRKGFFLSMSTSYGTECVYVLVIKNVFIFIVNMVLCCNASHTKSNSYNIADHFYFIFNGFSGKDRFQVGAGNAQQRMGRPWNMTAQKYIR